MLFRFEDAVLDIDAFELRVDNERVPLEPQVFEVLAHLVQNRDRLVTRVELLDTIWGDRFVSDGALASRIKAVRAAIGDDGRSQRLVRTVHGRGFQFVGHVETINSVATREPPSGGKVPHQSIRFATTADGTELAVATLGAGYPLVKAANWLTHVEKDWNSPLWRHWLTELGSRYTFVRYDARGCGLSSRDLSNTPLDDPAVWVDDLASVVDGQGVDRFALFGMSQGGVAAMHYAMNNPDRVSHLILYGCYLRGMNLRGVESAAQAKLTLDLIKVGWGGTNPAFRSFFTTAFVPEATSEQVRWFNDLQADTAPTQNAALLEAAFHDADLTDIASSIEVPTLVVHCERDMAVPFEEGRRLASVIPHAEFAVLDSANHILLGNEPAWPAFLARIDAFVGNGS